MLKFIQIVRPLSIGTSLRVRRKSHARFLAGGVRGLTARAYPVPTQHIMRIILHVIPLALLIGCARQHASESSTQLQSRNVQNVAERTRVLLTKIKPALDAFEIDCGRYPTTTEGLLALVNNPGALPWRGPYWDSDLAFTDAWGTSLRYQQDNSGLTLRSAGPDKIFQTSDDVVAIRKWNENEKWQ
jgi:Type II secretion system (T2SS), protein G